MDCAFNNTFNKFKSLSQPLSIQNFKTSENL